MSAGPGPWPERVGSAVDPVAHRRPRGSSAPWARYGLLCLAVELAVAIVGLGITVAVGIPMVVIMATHGRFQGWLAFVSTFLSVPSAILLCAKSMEIPVGLIRTALGRAGARPVPIRVPAGRRSVG
jgi:hypothetical protein